MGRFAGELRLDKSNLHRLAIFIFPLVGDFARLRLPNPRVGEIQSGALEIERVADSFNLPEGIQAVRLGKLFDDGRARLRRGSCRKDQNRKNHETGRC